MKRIGILFGILVLFLLVFRILDECNISLAIADWFQDEKTKSVIAKFIVSTKWVICSIAGFIIGSWDKLLGAFQQIKDNRPVISLQAEYTSDLRRSPVIGAEEIVEIGKMEKAAAYVKCRLKNQGKTEILMVNIEGKQLQCPILKNGDEYTFHFRMTPMNQLKIFVKVQNANNELYKAEYILSHDETTNTTMISSKRRFKRDEKNK